MGPPTGRSFNSQREEVPPNDEDDFDTTDSPGPRRPSVVRRRRYEEREYRRNVSTVDEVMDEATGYVTSFIADRMSQEGYNVPDEMRAVQRNVKKETADVLKQIGDDLVANPELNYLLSQITISTDTAFETFAGIASEIFTDGVINWGRIVALIYLGYRLAVKVLFEKGLLTMIIKWVVKFIGEQLVNWIVNSGGWDTCKSYLGSTSVQMMGVFMAGCALTALVFWWKRK